MNGKVLIVNGKNNDILKIVVAIKEGYLTKDNVFKYYYVFSYIITYTWWKSTVIASYLHNQFSFTLIQCM